VYLNAVKGLGALTDAFGKETLSAIMEKYADDSLDFDYRLRVGEALRQTIQRAGDTFAAHSMPFLCYLSVKLI
jgi:hypothetical protein